MEVRQRSATEYGQPDADDRNSYPRSPVRNCAAPLPKLQSAAEFSMMSTTTSLGAIPGEFASSCVS
jgi:hypothetical protein